jgi:uncharacterized RDD family membrane protein YckC
MTTTDVPPTASQPPTIAPLWRRIAAMLYDSFLVFAIWIVVGFFVLSAFGIEQARTVDGDAIVLDPWYRYTLLASMLLSAFLFFAFFWTHSGQTLGMQAWRIKVQNPDGSAISWRQSLLRCCTSPFSLLALGLGYLCMLVDPLQRTVPDRVSGSQVVRVPR